MPREHTPSISPDKKKEALKALSPASQLEVRIINQRQARRFSTRIPIQQINGRPTPDSYILDLSSLGLKIESPVPLAVNEPVELSFTLPHKEQSVRMAGLVVWNRPAPPYGTRFFLGVKLFVPQWEIDVLARQWEGLAARE